MKTPGFKYYEVPVAPVVQLPRGAGVTKVTDKVVGFYADYFTEEGADAPLHDFEIAGGVAKDVTEVAQERARAEAKAQFYL